MSANPMRAATSNPLPPELEATIQRPQFVTMNAQGRIVLPAEVRRALGLQPGERLPYRIDAATGQIRLYAPRLAQQALQTQLAQTRRADDVRASDELIAERRSEAAIEEARLRASDT